MTTRQLTRACHAAAHMAEITKRVTPHTLRHCFATHLLEQNIDIRIIQVLLGHAKVDTTALYTQVATNVIRAVMSPLDRLTPLMAKAASPRTTNRPPKARRACRARRWRSRISSAVMGRRGVKPMPASQSRPAQGDVGDRELPHGGARRACRTLPEVLAHPHRLQLLPQPALPEVPSGRGKGVAGRARGRAAAGALLPPGLHPAGADRRHRLSEQGRDLRSPAQGLGRDADHHRSRSPAPRRPHRNPVRPPYLGLGAHSPPPRAHDRAGWRSRSTASVGSPVGPATSSQCRFSPACSGGYSWSGSPPLRPPANCSSSASMPSSKMPKPSPLFSRHCATANGWSIASAPSGGPSKCCAISRATPTASPSQTAA